MIERTRPVPFHPDDDVKPLREWLGAPPVPTRRRTVHRFNRAKRHNFRLSGKVGRFINRC
jgi:hypothetical protein